MIAMHQERGALLDARNAAARASEIYRASGFLPFSQLYIQTHEMLIALAEGSLRKASDMVAVTARRKIANATEPPLSAMSRLTSAVIEYERTYREGAADSIEIALEQFGEGEAWFDQYALAYPVLVDVGWRRHGLDGVLAILEQTTTRLNKRGMCALDGYSKALEDHYRIRDGDPHLSLAHSDPASWRERDLRAHSEILRLLGTGQFDHAEIQATAWGADVIAGGRGIARTRAEILGAIAAEHMGRADDAERAMRSAIRLAFPEQIVASFVQEVPKVLPLLKRILAAGGPAMEQRHVEILLATVSTSAIGLFPKLLSAKESRIMTYVADGASNKLIARRMGVTDNAIKFHLKKVYAKLGVSSRKTAAAAALAAKEIPDYPN